MKSEPSSIGGAVAPGFERRRETGDEALEAAIDVNRHREAAGRLQAHEAVERSTQPPDRVDGIVVAQVVPGHYIDRHLHHLSARIPNYNLQAAHDANPIFHSVPTLSLWDGLRAVRLKLWDEDARRLVTFADARTGRAPETGSAQTEPAAS